MEGNVGVVVVESITAIPVASTTACGRGRQTCKKLEKRLEKDGSSPDH